MDKKTEKSQSFFKENVRFGVKGADRDIKALKAYLQMNPQSKMYIVEREEIEDKLPGKKRKVTTAKYLEIRDREGEEYNILLQVKMAESVLGDNYPVVMVSKETNDQGEEQFHPVSQLKHMMTLERGYIDIVNRNEEVTTEQETDEKQRLSNITRITKDMILSKEQRLLNEQKESDSANQNDQEKLFFITQANREQFKIKLEQFIRNKDNNDLTLLKIKTETGIRPLQDLENMLNELCYIEKNQKNAKVYKLKSK